MTAPDKDWWRGAVIYQIYPRSYQDSNGDGIGDLPGITRRLEYVASLGVDAIWISPFFRSPMLDFGYDVSDYCDVDPMFGTLADFDTLLAEAHRLDLKVMIDLVLSHTSDAHPWFMESRTARDNPRADWYVWADAKPDGTAPTNWLSIFGGPAWEWNTERQQYYLHNFLASQPDLNFHNPDVQQAVLDVARFWLDRGVDGFRLDTINFYFHDAELRDNPALPADQRSDSVAPSVNPYNWQDHLYDKNRPENVRFLERLRALMDEYPAVAAVGEVGDGQYGMQIQALYTAGDDRMQMCYDFSFLSSRPATGTRLAETLDECAEVNADGWSCWAFSNHDVPRHVTRWNLNDAASRTFAALLLSLRGSVCLYQGEELGLPEAEIAFEDMQDPYGIRFWPKFKGRDGCRTPMPWGSDEPGQKPSPTGGGLGGGEPGPSGRPPLPTSPRGGEEKKSSDHVGCIKGGFTDGTPWLPVPADHLPLSVARQEDEGGSQLHFYRAMIAFRARHPALVKGAIDSVDRADDRLVFVRSLEGVHVFCAFNLGEAPLALALPPGEWHAADAPFPPSAMDAGHVTVPPQQAFFATASIL